MNTEFLGSSSVQQKFREILYVLDGLRPSDVVTYGVENHLKVVCEQNLAIRLRLKKGTYVEKNCNPYTLPNPVGRISMHRSNGYCLNKLVSISSDYSSFCERALRKAIRSGKNMAYRWLLRGKDIVRHKRGQKIIDLPTTQRLLSPNIALTEHFTGMKWSNSEILPTEDGIHKGVLRTFGQNTYLDYDVVSFQSKDKKRHKKYSIHDGYLLQMDYTTLSGYPLRVIGKIRLPFPYGTVFHLSQQQYKRVHQNVGTKTLYTTRKNSLIEFHIGVLHEDVNKVKKMTGLESTGDFINLSKSIVMIGDMINQPLPFTLNSEPDETFCPIVTV